MAELNTFRCDECPAIRKETNHWFKAIAAPGYVFLRKWDCGLLTEIRDLQMRPGAIELHLCSESCAAKAMSKAIGAGQ